MVSLQIGNSSGKPKYKSALSVDSTTMSFETGGYVDVEAEENKHLRRRRFTILAIVAIFVTAGSILIFSVVHDLTNRPEMDFVDFTCPEGDTDCIESFCPVGWEWSDEEQACKQKPDYNCCVAAYKVSNEHLFYCWKDGEEKEHRCVTLRAGVAPSAYKQLCRPGYLWVHWRKKCQRKD